MSKIMKSFRLEADILTLLRELATKFRRSQANMIEHLITTAYHNDSHSLPPTIDSKEKVESVYVQTIEDKNSVGIPKELKYCEGDTDKELDHKISILRKECKVGYIAYSKYLARKKG